MSLNVRLMDWTQWVGSKKVDFDLIGWARVMGLE